ncbi:hypothetical protein DFP73DRAFT_474802 [Morchella snyderi]|nr:hypothetical protein DFP73DRAFT_474802 [Morchella snyderi]
MFLKALVDETNSPVHSYFFQQHEDFIEYDSDGSPRYQLDRLRALKSWDEAETLAAFYLFRLDFELEFDGKVDQFFAGYPDFPYNPRGNPMAEFRRLIEHKGWDLKDINCFGYGIEKKSDAELRVECGLAQTQFYLAFKDEFEVTFGADDEDVGTWENLCIVLGVVPIPDNMQLCRKKLAPLNVNIYDLIHFTRTGQPFTFFPTLQALRDYTIEKELFFPRELAKRGPLKFLLREILTIRRRRHKPRKLQKEADKEDNQSC